MESLTIGAEMSLLSRFTDLNEILASKRVLNTQRFLDLLKSCTNIVNLQFRDDQPQDLFDRLPEHCAVQWLSIKEAPSDSGFIFRLENLIELHLGWSVDDEFIGKVLQELRFILEFTFLYRKKRASIRVEYPDGWNCQKRFLVRFGRDERETSDVAAVVQFLAENARQNKKLPQ